MEQHQLASLKGVFCSLPLEPKSRLNGRFWLMKHWLGTLCNQPLNGNSNYILNFTFQYLSSPLMSTTTTAPTTSPVATSPT